MAKKTVLKNTISKWGILSIEMQQAVVVDQAVVNDVDTLDVDYVDAGNSVDSTKPTLTNDDVVSAIAEGLTVEQVEESYTLNDEQIKLFEDAK